MNYSNSANTAGFNVAGSNDGATAFPTTDVSEGGKGGKGGKLVADTAAPSSPPSDELPGEVAGPSARAPREDDVFRPASATNPVIAVLKAMGLYGSDRGGGEHAITCPWAIEHTESNAGNATYGEPTNDTPWGTFDCGCAHPQRRAIHAFVDKLGIERSIARCKPCIRIKNGEAHRIVTASEWVLANHGDLFRSDGVISRVRIDPATGDVGAEALSEQTLFMLLSNGADWERYDARSDSWCSCDVPQRIVTTVLKSQGNGTLPELKGLARQPFLRRDGSGLVTKPGYDQVSGIYGAFDQADFVFPEPTRANALAALERLKALLTEFEFANDTDKAGAIGGMLTASIRGSLPTAPALNITASSPGSGKSYLASVIARFAGPGLPRNISYPVTGEEASKVVLSLALEKPAVTLFDDMNGDWLPHGALNRMLTSGSISERMLGTNRVLTAPVSSFVMGTGNNIRPLRDMGRRVASIYLLPKTEAAAMREFEGNPDEEVLRHRGRYVSDALTIVRAFDACGRKRAPVANIAGFEEWSDLCRHSLIWLGEPDPATSMIAQIKHDPDTDMLADLLRAWSEAFGERPTMVRQVLQYIDKRNDSDLYDAIMELPCVERGHVNQSKFGRYLGRYKNRIVANLQLVEAAHSERKAWAVKWLGRAIEAPAVPRPVHDDIPERTWMKTDLLAA